MIIGDSSALVALATMDRLDLLEKIFGKIYVPKLYMMKWSLATNLKV